MTSATTQSITAKRGDTFQARTLTVEYAGGVDVLVSSARIQVRNRKTDAVLYEWSTTLGTITLALGTITLYAVAAATTSAWVPGDYVLDVEMVIAGQTISSDPISFIVSADITR
jgi:hypothetical protein